MKDILTRLFNHEELTSEETKADSPEHHRGSLSRSSNFRITHCVSNA